MKKLLLILMSAMLCACSSTPPVEEEIPPTIDEEIEPIKEDSFVTFAAVGDNLIHGAIYYDSMVRHGEYVFDEVYEETKAMSEAADVAYINQETILGGTQLGLSHYPMFNSPQEVGVALVNAGYDWIASSSNHSMDKWSDGIINTLAFWDQYPDVVTTGINRSQEEADSLKIIERNGVKIGVLGYTYGTNGITIPQGQEYLVNLYSEEKIRADINRLKDKCDTIMVSMHWGVEYSTIPNEEQKAFAKLMADLGVSVVIGEHPHVIQPMEWVEGINGNKTLVIYSLGNFLSAQDSALSMLGGMATWTLRKSGQDNTISVENVKFYPTVTHFKQGFTEFKTYLLKDYTEELAAQHGLNGYNGQLITRDLFVEYTNEIMNDEFELIY